MIQDQHYVHNSVGGIIANENILLTVVHLQAQD